MFSRYALQQDVLEILKQADKGTKDIVPGKSPKQLRANYVAARERLTDLGEVVDFGYTYMIGRKCEDRTVTFRHGGYNIELTVSGRYNVASELKRRGPRRQCYCSTAFRLAKGHLRREPNPLGNCGKHIIVLEEKDEKSIGNILRHYEGGNTGLFIGSGRYTWRSGICEGNLKDWQLGVSPRKQTKLWELELHELLAAQRKLITTLRRAER